MTDEQTLPAAHRAIRLAKAQQISGAELLTHLVDGQVSVPVAALPDIQDGKIKTWQPAVFTLEDGSRWLFAFTTPELASDYCGPETSPFYMTVDTRWVLRSLSPGLGIVFNAKSKGEFFKWSAQGIASYKQKVLGW